MCEQQRATKGLKFGDRQNRIYDGIRVGVSEDTPTTGSIHKTPNPDIITNAMQHDTMLADEEHHEENANDTIEEDAIEIEDDENNIDK